MKQSPYVLAKCAISIDGYLDDTSDERLILSNKEDFDIVDIERAKCDAILLGAETIRKDNPRALIRSKERRKSRLENGKSEDLIKVTVTTSGEFGGKLNYFTHGDAKKIIYCSNKCVDKLRSDLGHLVEIIPFSGDIVDPVFLLNDLYSNGIRKLIIEGGSRILTMFLGKGLVDELQVSIAPFFLGDSKAPKLVNSARFIHDKNNRMKLENVKTVGDMAMITYKLFKLPLS